jgi:hypothetical protein
MAYSNGWDEIYTYDDAGQLLTQLARDPSDKVNKQILHTYSYDNQGNILNETSTGAGGQDKFDYTHSYDALNRLTQTTGLWGYPTHTYEYDSLGNLLYERRGISDSNEYWYNNLNQQVRKQVNAGDYYANSFDGRGNLISVLDEGLNEIVEEYTYDSTNRMVKGINAKEEQSHYIYNGMGYLVANEWIIEKGSYGYQQVGISTEPSEQVNGVVVYDRHANSPVSNQINPIGKGYTVGGTEGGIVPVIDKGKYAVIHKDYVLDYTSPLQNVIMETENVDGGLTYRYAYGLEKANVAVYGTSLAASVYLESYNYPTGPQNIVKLHYHHDRLGSTDYLTSNLGGNSITGRQGRNPAPAYII